MDEQFHGVPHGSVLHQGDLCAWDHAHIQKMLPQGAFASHGGDARRFSDAQLVQRHDDYLPVPKELPSANSMSNHRLTTGVCQEQNKGRGRLICPRPYYGIMASFFRQILHQLPQIVAFDAVLRKNTDSFSFSGV